MGCLHTHFGVAGLCTGVRTSSAARKFSVPAGLAPLLKSVIVPASTVPRFACDGSALTFVKAEQRGLSPFLHWRLSGSRSKNNGPAAVGRRHCARRG